MQKHNTSSEEPKATNTNYGETANFQGVKTYYQDSSFLIKGCQMGEISMLGLLIGFCRHVTWAASLHFLYTELFAVSKIFAYSQRTW